MVSPFGWLPENVLQVITTDSGNLAVEALHQISATVFPCTSLQWNFQNIVLQAVATKWKNHARRKTVPPITFPQDQYWEPAAVLIWPPTGRNLQWPPEFFLGAKSLYDFRDRWNEIKVTFS